MTSFDVHQHLWPEPFLSALSRRSMPPFLNGRTLATPEGEFEVDLSLNELPARLERLDRDGIDVAVLSLPPTLGIEALPDDEGDVLLAAYHDGARDLVASAGGRLRAFAAGAALEGFVGASVAARAVSADLDRLDVLLRELERSGRVLFIHPGPAHPAANMPAWWAPVVDYTAEMQAAYAAWLARGAERYPGLRVIFAILAGGGPFQLERLRSRGVDVRSTLHPTVFFDTASYGHRALELCLATYGVGHLVYGSDTPVIDPHRTLQALLEFGDAVTDAVCRENPQRLLA